MEQYSCSWIGRFTTVKMSVLPIFIYRLIVSPIKLPASYFVHIDKVTLKILWRGKRPGKDNIILKENKLENCYFLTSRLTIKI